MKTIAIFALLLFSSASIAQEATEFVNTEINEFSTWTTYFENDQVKIEFKRTDCDLNSGLDKQYLYLRYSNKTQTAITMNWHIDMYYNDDCRTCDYDEYDWSYSLAPGEVAEGTCEMGADRKLQLFAKFIDANYTNDALLTGFKFSNLTIE